MKNIDEYRIAELIFLELKEELNETNRKILHDWINESYDNLELYNKIINKNNIVTKIDAYNKIDKKEAWIKLNKKLGKNKKTKRIQLKSILKYAAAASILLLIGSYLLIRKSSLPKDEIKTNSIVILSGTQKATLTTSNNEKIELGELEKRRTFHLTNASVTDTNKTLTFQYKEAEQPEKTPEVAINTLETPRGGEYTLILSDGTRIFLNAETKLIFPDVFTKDKREVILDGEAYLEVTKSETKPFIVKTSEFKIKVYGTSFNVSAYSSDINSHTTLVEGNVGISINTGTEVRLIPGEHAYFDKTDNSLDTRKVDVDVYTSWKDGKFVFDNESLEGIMRKLERWYNVETEYLNRETMNYHFSGTLDRYGEISEVLNMIALTTNIDFKIKGNKIIVNKKNN